MKNVLSVLTNLIMALCLGLYSPFGVAGMGNDGVAISMEICADGVAKTILVGADGNPVERNHKCAECLTCCTASGNLPDVEFVRVPTLALLEITAENRLFEVPVTKHKNVLPAPRAPPFSHDGIIA